MSDKKTFKQYLQEAMEQGRLTGDYESPTAMRWAEQAALEGDLEKAIQISKSGAIGAMMGVGAALNASSLLTYGLWPTILSNIGAYVGGEVGHKVGDKIDKHYGTKWVAPTLSFAGGLYGGGKGWNTAIKTTAKGWIPKSSIFTTTDKFVNSQVVPQMFNQSVNNTALKPITQFRNRIIPYKAKINREEMLDTFLKAKWDTEHRAIISDAERLGIPKGERNNRFKYPKFNTAHTDADFYVIHRSNDVWPVNGDMISFQMGMPKQVETKTGQQVIQYPMSLHTTFGREVQSHMEGGWNNSKITYLIPYKDMVLFNGYPHVTTPMDTYWISGTRIGMPKNNVRALTHDKKTFLQLKRNGINATYNPNASDQNFRQKWIEQQSMLQGMPINNSDPDFVVPKSEILKLHNEYDLAHPNLKIGDRTGWSTGVQFYDDVLSYERVPKAHFGHWTFGLYHPYNVPKHDFFEGHISSAINIAPIGSTNMNWLDPVAFQGAVKKLGLRKLRLRRMDYDPQYAGLVKEYNNWIEEINNLVSGKKYIKYNHGGQIK